MSNSTDIITALTASDGRHITRLLFMKDLQHLQYIALTLVRVTKNNHVKGFLGSILTLKRVLGSYLTHAYALKSLGLPMFRA